MTNEKRRAHDGRWRWTRPLSHSGFIAVSDAHLLFTLLGALLAVKCTLVCDLLQDFLEAFLVHTRSKILLRDGHDAHLLRGKLSQVT